MRTNPRQAELAAELLDVTGEHELAEFLEGLMTETAWHAGELPVATGQELLRELRKTVVRTVPTVAALVGDRPRSGETPAATAARVYGLELEGLSAEDRDYEIAQEFIRCAQAAITAAGQRH
ncbi:hypothetical protein AB0L70_04755 [Kribbella sp. NPDC051952]|uniref:hypothetical protein n=1 Tax=Kribbella sp. NPDC051952 TaxID=3154851 RepID=UPI00341E839A